MGDKDDGAYLISRAAFKSGLIDVSKVRLEKTLYAEHPRLKQRISQLEGAKAEQRLETLAAIWNTSIEEARVTAEELVEVGFFEQQGSKQDPEYWVPFLYRSALNLVQGTASLNARDE